MRGFAEIEQQLRHAAPVRPIACVGRGECRYHQEFQQRLRPGRGGYAGQIGDGPKRSHRTECDQRGPVQPLPAPLHRDQRQHRRQNDGKELRRDGDTNRAVDSPEVDELVNPEKPHHHKPAQLQRIECLDRNVAIHLKDDHDLKQRGQAGGDHDAPARREPARQEAKDKRDYQKTQEHVGANQRHTLPERQLANRFRISCGDEIKPGPEGRREKAQHQLLAENAQAQSQQRQQRNAGLIPVQPVAKPLQNRACCVAKVFHAGSLPVVVCAHAAHCITHDSIHSMRIK